MRVERRVVLMAEPLFLPGLPVLVAGLVALQWLGRRPDKLVRFYGFPISEEFASLIVRLSQVVLLVGCIVVVAAAFG